MKTLLSSRSARTALVVALAAASSAAQSLLSQHGEIIIGCGENVPGLPGVSILSTTAFAFDTPVIDANGTVVFRARLAGATTTNDDRAILMGRSYDDLRVVARADDPAPGLPGVFMRSTSSSGGPNANVQISPFGEYVYFSTSLNDNGVNVDSSNDSALIWVVSGLPLMLAREGDQAPGVPVGALYGSLSSFSRQNNTINSNGVVVFPCQLTGAVTAADDACLFSGGIGGIALVMREGDDAGLGGGETFVPSFGSTMSGSSQINDLGQIFISGKLGGTATPADDTFLGVYLPGTGVQVFAREGSQAPGMAPGVVLTGSPAHGASVWSNSGNAAFVWNVDDGGATIGLNNDQVLWLGGLGGVVKAAQEDDPIGTPGGERFGSINNTSVTSNVAGQIAFFAGLRDSTGAAMPSNADSGMYLGTPGNWTEVVREGDVLPIPPSANGPWVVQQVNGTANLNANGQLMFNQNANDGGGSVQFFLVYDEKHGLQVLRDGTESYTTALGTGTATTSVSTVGAFSGGDGCPAWFNNNGDMVFRQSIDNGPVAAIVRGHTGTLIATPSSIDVVAGGTQTFFIDAGPTHAFNIYVLVGSQSGTRPGTVLPLGPLTIPLNFDSWTQLSLDLVNTPIYTNTLWFLDADGRSTASFTMPPALGIPAFELNHAVVGLDFSLTETFVSEPAALRLR